MACNGEADVALDMGLAACRWWQRKLEGPWFRVVARLYSKATSFACAPPPPSESAATELGSRLATAAWCGLLGQCLAVTRAWETQACHVYLLPMLPTHKDSHCWYGPFGQV